MSSENNIEIQTYVKSPSKFLKKIKNGKISKNLLECLEAAEEIEEDEVNSLETEIVITNALIQCVMERTKTLDVDSNGKKVEPKEILLSLDSIKILSVLITSSAKLKLDHAKLTKEIEVNSDRLQVIVIQLMESIRNTVDAHQVEMVLGAIFRDVIMPFRNASNNPKEISKLDNFKEIVNTALENKKPLNFDQIAGDN